MINIKYLPKITGIPPLNRQKLIKERFSFVPGTCALSRTEVKEVFRASVWREACANEVVSAVIKKEQWMKILPRNGDGVASRNHRMVSDKLSIRILIVCLRRQKSLTFAAQLDVEAKSCPTCRGGKYFSSY